MSINFGKYGTVFKALGHPIRLKIAVGLIENGGCNVNKIVRELGIPQSTVSQHLSTLRHAGIIEPEKNGVSICYRISDKKLAKLIRSLDAG